MTEYNYLPLHSYFYVGKDIYRKDFIGYTNMTSFSNAVIDRRGSYKQASILIISHRKDWDRL